MIKKPGGSFPQLQGMGDSLWQSSAPHGDVTCRNLHVRSTPRELEGHYSALHESWKVTSWFCGFLHPHPNSDSEREPEPKEWLAAHMYGSDRQASVAWPGLAILFSLTQAEVSINSTVIQVRQQEVLACTPACLAPACHLRWSVQCSSLGRDEGRGTWVIISLSGVRENMSLVSNSSPIYK